MDATRPIATALVVLAPPGLSPSLGIAAAAVSMGLGFVLGIPASQQVVIVMDATEPE